MGCCFRNKNEDPNDSIKITGKIKNDYSKANNYGDNNDEKNYFKNTNEIADNNIRKTTGRKEDNNFGIFENKQENYIKAEINIDENNINKDIRIINSFEETKRIYKWKDEEDDFKYENEKEIKNNCEIKINKNTIQFNYFYKFNKKGIFQLEYSFKNNIKNVAYMFFECNDLEKIDLSKFNTQNVTNMNNMFSRCYSLTNIDLSNFYTQNVTKMCWMFS